jgi:Mce-associated membrane protein
MTRRLREFAVPTLALLLVIAGIWLSWDTSVRRGAQRSGEDAMAAARDSIVAMLSYQPDSAEKSLNDARGRLTGQFLDAYTQLIQTVVVPSAKKDRITAVAKVPATSVVSADADRAVVLAFVDQTLTEGTKAPTLTTSSVRVSMEKVDDHWLIAGFDPV